MSVNLDANSQLQLLRSELGPKRQAGPSSQFSRVPQTAVIVAQIWLSSKETVRFAIQWYSMAIRPSVTQ